MLKARSPCQTDLPPLTINNIDLFVLFFLAGLASSWRVRLVAGVSIGLIVVVLLGASHTSEANSPALRHLWPI